jgi:hypothetical protein
MENDYYRLERDEVSALCTGPAITQIFHFDEEWGQTTYLSSHQGSYYGSVFTSLHFTSLHFTSLVSRPGVLATLLLEAGILTFQVFYDESVQDFVFFVFSHLSVFLLSLSSPGVNKTYYGCVLRMLRTVNDGQFYSPNVVFLTLKTQV